MQVTQTEVVYELRLADDPEPMFTTMGVNGEDSGASLSVSMANDFFDAFEEHLCPLISHFYEFVSATINYQQSGGTESYRSTRGATECGLEVSTTPQNSAYLVRKHTAAVGRGKSGRMYIPGVGEASVLPNGTVEGPTVLAWNTALGLWLATFVDDVTAAAVVNHTAGTPLWSDITSLSLDGRIATQRRRMRP